MRWVGRTVRWIVGCPQSGFPPRPCAVPPLEGDSSPQTDDARAPNGFTLVSGYESAPRSTAAAEARLRGQHENKTRSHAVADVNDSVP